MWCPLSILVAHGHTIIENNNRLLLRTLLPSGIEIKRPENHRSPAFLIDRVCIRSTIGAHFGLHVVWQMDRSIVGMTDRESRH